MSRRMDYKISFDAPAEKVYQDFTSRDVPCLASPAYGSEIAAHLAKLSAAFGTEVQVENGRGLIRL